MPCGSGLLPRAAPNLSTCSRPVPTLLVFWEYYLRSWGVSGHRGAGDGRPVTLFFLARWDLFIERLSSPCYSFSECYAGASSQLPSAT